MDAIGDNLFIIVFLLISFFSWVSGKLKERGQGSAPTYEQPQSDFEPAEQQQQSPSQDPMREILESLGIPAGHQAPPSKPPPLPEPLGDPAPPPFKELDKKGHEEQLSKEERDALQRIQEGQGLPTRRKSKRNTSATTMLRPHNLQEAFKVKEILDKPRSFGTLDL